MATLVVAAVLVLAVGLATMYLLRPSAPSPVAGAPSSLAVSASPEPERLLTSAAARPRTSPSRVSVAEGSGGRSCAPTRSSGWEGYPGASCTFWQAATGLLLGRALAKGPQTVACQARLGVENPVYREGQENTWWLWAMTGEGSWDWYPETAITEGVSGKPVDGVALCVA